MALRHWATQRVSPGELGKGDCWRDGVRLVWEDHSRVRGDADFVAWGEGRHRGGGRVRWPRLLAELSCQCLGEPLVEVSWQESFVGRGESHRDTVCGDTSAWVCGSRRGPRGTMRCKRISHRTECAICHRSAGLPPWLVRDAQRHLGRRDSVRGRYSEAEIHLHTIDVMSTR